jgi:hypothetical protein
MVRANRKPQELQEPPMELLPLPDLTVEEISLAFLILTGEAPENPLPPPLDKLLLSEWDSLAILLQALQREMELVGVH